MPSTLKTTIEPETEAGHMPATFPFDPDTHYPIAYTLVSLLSLDLLHTVRGVSRAYRELCDATLAYQLVITSETSPDFKIRFTREPDTHQDAQTRTKYAAPRVPGLEDLEDCTSPEQVPEAARRILALVRVVDVTGLLHDRRGAEQRSRLSILCASIAPYLTGLVTVRVDTTILPDKIPFVGKTLVLWAQRDHLLVVPTFSGFEQLVINLPKVPLTRFPTVPAQYSPHVKQVTLQFHSSVVFGYLPHFDESGEAALREVLLSAVDRQYLSRPTANFAIVIRSSRHEESANKGPAQDKIASCMQRCIGVETASLKFVKEDDMCNASQLFWDEDYRCRPLHTFFKLTRVIDPPVNRALSRLESALALGPQQFSSQGTSASPMEPVLFVRSRTKSHRVFLPINETAFRYLHEASEPTTGMGRMLDPTMFALTPDVVLGTGILHEIQHIHGIPPVTAVPVAITIYAASEGREPSGPQDYVCSVPHGNDQPLGRILVRLPSPGTGGDLTLSANGETQIVSWKDINDFQWVFVYEHVTVLVGPVTSSAQVFLEYAVFQWHKPPLLAHPALSEPITEALRETLANDHVLPDGGALCVGMQELYTSPPTASTLKPTDQVWASALAAAGLGFRIVAAYKGQSTPPDILRTAQTYRRRNIATSFSFREFDKNECPPGWTMDMFEVDEAVHGERHWVTLPKHWGMANHYSVTRGAYAGSRVEKQRVGVAFLVEIGPAGSRLDKSVPAVPEDTEPTDFSETDSESGSERSWLSEDNDDDDEWSSE